MQCRFLYLIGQLHTGGSERQLYYLLKAMGRELYKPAVAVWTYGESDLYVRQVRELGVRLYSFTKDASRAKKLREFRRLVRRLRPAIVHSFSFYTNFAAYWGTRGTDAIPIGSVRSALSYAKQSNSRLLGNLSARWPSIQTSNSSSVAEEFKQWSFFAPKRLAVVRNGIDISQFPHVSIPENRPITIASVGYLLPVKRWDRLLLACRELIKTGNLDFFVKIAGDGPLSSTLRNKACELKLTDRVQFLGHVEHVAEVLAEASFLVHTADSEGSPNSVLEAMACGRPVICTAVGDVSALVEDGRTGFLVPWGDDAALVDRMRTLITDRDLCKRMGVAARLKVEREFGLDRLVNETLEVYRAAGWIESTPQ
jgi:glycosyltransferase involved in cell wall biosynthesis